MSASAYAIGHKMWVVRTRDAAEPGVPETLPLGSIILTADEAILLGEQMRQAGVTASKRTDRVMKPGQP